MHLHCAQAHVSKSVNHKSTIDLSTLSGQFLLTTDQIRDVVTTARDRALQRGTALTIDDLLLAAAEAHENRQDTALDLGGMRILYVGGQTRLAPHLRSLVEAHNGRFEHHDGGVEESRAGLQCALAGADLVFCPVDCISHDACQRAKQHCWQQNKRFIPLRSSGLSAFAAGLRYHSTSGIPPRGN